MYYVYVLQSLLEKEAIYIGYTNDIKVRLKQHNNGENISTRLKKPWRLVYCECFRAKKDAVIRERKLKQHGKGKQELKKRLQYSLS